MFSITNEKIAGFVPQWAEFRGFSILFDNPGDCLTPYEDRLELTCDIQNNPEIGLYWKLHDGLIHLNPNLLMTTYLFCPLPTASYHVTAWDGGNQASLGHVLANHRPQLEDYLNRLPDVVSKDHIVTDMALASPLVCKRNWNIEFQFDEIMIWGSVMVARLTPTEAASGAFEQFVAERRRLNISFRDAFGIGASENLTPHVSLGYFANREGAQLARPCLREWNQLFAERLQGSTLTFAHASLYGFTDMATFFTSAVSG